MTVIAMTRKIGSLGIDVATGVVDRLRLTIIDSEIAARSIAERLGVEATTITPTVKADYQSGISVGLAAFTAAIIGGFNQVRGALFGGFLVGVVQNWSGRYLSSAYREAIPYLLLIAIILWRPQGLFGRAEERRL